MIQRKQTIFLFLAVVASVVCMSLPIGVFEPEGMGISWQVFNLWAVNNAEKATVFTPAPLFALLLLETTVAFLNIFAYKKRVMQARMCTLCMWLIVAWYAYYAVLAFVLMPENTTFKADFAACLPFVAVILLIMARRGIRADERLVRAADRIR